MSKQWKWALSIVAFCILAPIASGITYIGIRGHAMNGGAATVAAFLGDLQDHDYPAAHALLSPAEQAAVSVAAVQTAQEQIEKKKGRWLLPAEPNEFHPNGALDHIWYL